MRACIQGRSEVATILYHWNSAAAALTNHAGQTCAEVAGASSCPQFKEELERMERQRNNELLESTKAQKEQKPEFLKPGRKIIKKVVRAPSLEGYLGVPGSTRRSPSPLRSPGLRPFSASVRSLRGGSPASLSHADAIQRKLKLSKRPSVDSGINIDMQHVKTNSKDVRQLSK